MNKKLLFATVLMLIVLATGAVQVLDLSREARPTKTLTFPEEKSVTKEPAKPVTIDSTNIKYQQKLRKKLTDQSLKVAFSLFWREYPTLENRVQVEILFQEVGRIATWKEKKESPKLFDAFSAKLVSTAMAETNSGKREAIIRYQYHYSTDKRRLYINLPQQFRPGEKVYFSQSYWHRRNALKQNYVLQKIELDKNYQISGYTTIKKSETPYLTSRDRVDLIDSAEAGIYRLTVFTDHQIQDRFFQVNWLDAVMKRDREKILVYGASFKDTVPGPYKVHFVSSKKKLVSTETDTNGLAVLNFADSSESPSVIVEKEGHFAFIRGIIPHYRKDTTIGTYCYTERPIYRPGQKVYFKALLHRMIEDGIISPGTTEKVTLNVINPEGKSVRTATCVVNNWGHVVDSFSLSANAKQGQYIYTISSLTGSKYALDSYTAKSVAFTVEAYKKPQFKIDAKTAKETYSTKDTIAVDIKGEYFFGGALADQTVKVRWYRRDIYHSRGYGRYKYRFYPHGTKSLVRQDELTLDKEGKVKATFFTEKEQDSHYLIAECILTDESRREIRKEVEVKVVDGAGFLFIQPDKWQYEVDEEASFEVTAIDLEGNGITKPVNLRLKRNNTLVQDTTIKTNEDGTLFYKKTFTREGSYQLEATVKMPDGSYLSATSYNVNVVKVKRWNYQWEHVELKLDKQEYNVGDTAALSIKCGAKDTRALLTAEGNTLLTYEAVSIGENKYECRIPITKEIGRRLTCYFGYSGSNRFVSRQQSATIVDSSLLLTATLTGEKSLKPGDTFTGKLTITDKEGKPVFANFSVALVDEAIFHIPITNSYNPYRYRYFGYNRNQKEKGVLSLLPYYSYGQKIRTQNSQFNMDLLTSFAGISLNDAHYSFADAEVEGYMDSGLNVSFNMDESVGSGFGGGKTEMAFESAAPRMKALKKSKASPSMIVADKDSRQEPPRERSEFKDLGYWNSSITTNKRGEAAISFIMPDDLTKWRLMIVGNDGMSKLIDFRDSLITKMDVMVKLEAPRVFVEGDSLLLTSVVHNYSGKKLNTTMAIKLKDEKPIAQLKGKTKQKLTLQKGETSRIDWPLIVKAGGELTAYTEVISKRGSDAESRTYPVLVNGIQRSESFVGTVSSKKQSTTMSLALPKDGRPGSREVTLNYSPSMAQTMFESLDYLTGFPYGCVEQTMSRFLPNLYVAATMERLDMKNDTLLAKIPEYTSKGLERLANFQHVDGGWGWWENDKSDPRMTALVVYGLNYALKSNYVDDNDKETMTKMLKRAIPMVHNFIKHGRKDVNHDQKVNLIYALKDTKGLSKLWATADSLRKEEDSLSVKALSQLIEICHTLEKTKERDALVKSLLAKARKGSNGTYWGGSSTYRWYRQDEEATAQAVNALTSIGHDEDIIEAAVHWLSRKKKNGYWVSTKTTAAVLNSMSTYLANSQEFNPDYTVTVSVDGKELKKVKVSKENMGEMAGELIIKEADLKKNSNLTLDMSGSGKLFYSVVNRYVTKEQPSQARENGIKLTRSYQRLDYSKDKKGNWQVKRVPFDGVCKSGDEIEVTVTMECDGSYEHVMVEDFFPAGMEVLKKSQDWYDRWCGWWWRGYDNREARDDRMVFFMSWANKGTTTMTYLLRAETPGRFTALPTKAECMYEPNINGNSEAMTVLINN